VSDNVKRYSLDRVREMLGDELRYTLEGRPTSWKRTNTWQGRRITGRDMKRAQDAHRWAATAARPKAWALDAEMALEVSAYMPNARSAPDADNVLKLVADALQGIAYANDRQLVRVVCERHIDRENPRTEVVVRRLP
jgi:Holliday junction resolvase RusA-like endonuclease